MTNSPEIARARQVFRFLKAFAERGVPSRRRLADQLWTLRVYELPDHPVVSVGEVRLGTGSDAVELESESQSEPLLRVGRPRTTMAPEPPAILNDFLKRGWEDPTSTIEVIPARSVAQGEQTISERFDASPARVTALAEWQTRWNAWAATERPARQAMRVFERLYDLHGRIEREGEDVELMLGDGRLRWRHAEGPIDHPILLQRVELVFDASVPEFRVLDADRGPELYEALIGSGETISAAQLNQLRVELEQAGYHPLERTATSGFLRRLVRFLGPHGVFRDRPSETPPGPDPHVTRDPVFFLRTRNAGYPAAFDRVLSDLDTRSALPIALTRLVGVEPPPDLDLTHQASSPWGEPQDVLLSKPANPEQIQIARALERYRAVLVQGPPGTGKSHTIANLIGHLVAQGKRVLVTSHTTKALRVLREQIVEPLRPLCVAVLDNDLEGRKQMEQAVRGILTRLTESSEEQLEREAGLLVRQREALLAQMDAVTTALRAVREAEYLPVIEGGEPIDPAEAARWLKDKAQGNDWIPGPIQQGSPLPLAEAELRELYAMNGRLSADEETEISEGLPEVEVLPAPAWFAELVGALHATETPELAAFWEEPPSLDHEPALAHLVGLVRTAAEELARMEPWQRAVVAAGHTGGSEHTLWMELAEIVRDAARGWDHARPLLLEHEVTVQEEMTSGEWHGAVTEITQHLSGGGSLNSLTLLVNPRWKKVIRSARINGREPSVQIHFKAATEFIALRETRQRLGRRWARQAEPIGLPKFGEFGATPEPIAQQYAMQFEGLLTWWKSRWTEIEAAMAAADFRWTDLRAREIARAAPVAPFEQDSAILSGPLQAALTTRLGIVRRARAGRTLEALDNELSHFEGPVCAALHNAVRQRDPRAYDAVFASLKSLVDRRAMWQQRNLLLKAMQATAPGWSEALRKRAGVHGAAELPGDVALAWRWRQLRQEIDRRASLDERALMRQLHQLRDALRTLTGQVIDRRAWLSQLQRTDLVARQALQGWADTQKKIGKGTGQRVPALQTEARRLLTEARDAVPVWIMPLSRVADSFDATRGRFDVVIIDEASQSDVTGLLAWYLGDRIAVVGDHEQVSPMAVGQQIGAMQALIAQHLDGVPNNHLYDGTTSVYDLARQCFGGTIALREHFRCVPDIIEFSNELSYNNEIRPLRDASNVPRPHVIEYMVDADLGSERTGKTNLAEARVIVSLMKALTEMPEYSRRTMSAITLLGDEQAELIQELALRLLGAVELERRRFVAGNSAQFQGDERDVIFLSLVDTPIGGALPLRETESFKQRYNVAVSRAKDQLWLVHSLDPAHDLKAGDLRRRLIEYVRDPGAKRRAMQRAERRVESPLETAVSRRLVAEGYRVQTQVWIGRYRIDMMVSDDHGHVAIECDGERYHGMEDIAVDMARQAVLERAGWRFIRVRSTRFYSDPDGTVEWLFEQLHALGIERSGSAPHHSGSEAHVAAFRESVLRRAMEIMRDQQWLPPEPEHTPLPPPPPVVASRREKRKNGGAH